MAHVEFEISGDASPEMVRAALLDFTDRRPELWPGLPRDQYAIYEVGDTSAEIREGYRGPIWNRERYDWSVPGRVEFTVVDSGFGGAGGRGPGGRRVAGGGGIDAAYRLGPAGQGPLRPGVRRPDGVDPWRGGPSLVRAGSHPDRR